MKNDWPLKPLGELLQRTGTVNPLQSPEAEFDYIDVSSVSNATFQIETTQRLKGKDAPSRARKLVRTNDILFATIRPTLQRIAVVPENLDGQVCSTGYCVLRPKPVLDHRFAFYALFTEQFMGQMASLQKGASYPAVTEGDVKAQLIPVPPLREQQRLIGILDKVFAATRIAKGSAEKNIQNANDLFESELQSVFTHRDSVWKSESLGNLASFRNGINYTQNSKGEIIRIVGVRNFQNNFAVPMDDLDSVTLDGKVGEMDLLRRNDILAVRSNGNIELIGRCMLVGQVEGKVAHSGFTIRIRMSSHDVLPEYLCRFLKSAATRRLLIEGGTGTNIKSLNQGMLTELIVPYPSISKQEILVHRLQCLEAETRHLQSIYQQKLDAVEALDKSLLHQPSRAHYKAKAMNESETRAEYIDPALAAAGWGVVEGSRILREYGITLGRIEGHGKRGKPLTADYVLTYRNHKLAVVEAKAYDEELTEGVAQAKNYAGKLAIRYTYASNGRGIYGIDMTEGTEGELLRYPTPDELWSMTFAAPSVWRDRFSAIPFPDRSGTWSIRFYQEIAVNRVLEQIERGRDRILLTLATGTGKTSIAFQIAWKLFQARWNLVDWRQAKEPSRRPRILFLADRNTLATQAYNDFTSFAAFPEDALVRIKPDDIKKKGRVPKNGSLFFTIFQTFMSGPPKDGQPSPYFGEYPPDFFDFIIIDECHRGGANDESTWRDILEYFRPAVQLGLTATPKRVDNVDTYAYFGDPVYTYSLKDGINDGFLTPFKVKQIATTLDDYVYTPDDNVIEGEVEAGRRYVESDFNKIIEIKEREAHRVAIFMEQINQHEKTLVFCATQDHALAVRDLINQMKASKDPNYCQRVTAADGALGDQYLREFQDNEKTIPTILTTSQKLSTGVDARNIRNIVLMRPINSMIEFKQIIGRGTRLFDGKDYFTIYDFVRAHHHFNDPEWDGEPMAPEPRAPRRPRTEQPEEPAGPEPEPTPLPPRQKLKVKLADGKARSIQHMMVTSFWHPDGTPMSAQQFLEMLFGRLPEFFKDEDELRALWSSPDTRAKLLHGLAEKGFGPDQMSEMQRIIEAEKSDLFDVLANVAYALPTMTREERAAQARIPISAHFNAKQQAFLDFVLNQYVQVGVGELDKEKLSPLLRLKYNNAIADAIADLGRPEEIGKVFLGFQKYLYEQAPEARPHAM